MAQCRADGISRITVDAIQPSSLLTDSSFLSKLQSDVSSWVKDIQSITKLDRDVPSGTASQEINFWISMERALEGIKAQLKSDPIVLELDILKHAKRFHATVSFDSDTGLTEMTARGPSTFDHLRPACLPLTPPSTHTVHSYCQLMKDFPLNELLSATDLERIRESILIIFKHLYTKLKLSSVSLFPSSVRRATLH